MITDLRKYQRYAGFVVLQVFEKPMALEPEKAEKVTLAACTLHNYIRANRPQSDVTTPDSMDTDNGEQNFAGLGGIAAIHRGQNASNRAKEIRNKFCDHFNGAGAVEWQNRMV